MRKKKLLTAALCAVLALASYTVSSAVSGATLTIDKVEVVSATYAAGEKEDKQEAEAAPAAETAPQVKAAPETSAPAKAAPAPETSAPAKTAPAAETSAPAAETAAPETQAPAAEPQAPETQAPAAEPQPPATEPSAPETQPPATEPSAPETQPPATEPSVPEIQPPATEPSVPETQPPATEPSSETQSSETQPSTSETVPSETGTEAAEPETDPQETEQHSESTATEAGTEEETQSETETETESETESEEESESETSEYGSNEELIAHQNIVIPPDISLEFRFTKVEKRYGVVCVKDGTDIYEKKSTDARAAGTLEYYGLCYILEDKEDGWYYIESGNVRGFVPADRVVTDEVAQRIFRVKGKTDGLPEARLLLARTENEAFSYTQTTVQEVLAEKKYALAKHGEVKIYEQRKKDARVTGTLQEGALCYLLADEDREWIFVESGNARGFVKKSELTVGAAATQRVAEAGESNLPLASVLIEPEDNKACYYTLTSVKKASQAALTREAMVNFALQFIGNPYVWGGTSLTNGADCSGFVQSIYANFGYSLPRVAEAQSVCGMQIPVDSAEPGDLIFYARNGYVYHVSMYIGDGRVVHAAGKKVGIITSGIGGNAVWATRLITD